MPLPNPASASTPSIEAAFLQGLDQATPLREGPREGFWMSQLGMCPRAQIAARAGLPATNPPALHSRFKMWTGRILGQELAKLLESTGFLDPAYTEKAVQYRSYRGKLDGLTHRLNGLGDAVVEIKTADDRSVKYPDLPETYLWQAMTYCLATGLSHALIFQIGKNQGLTRQQVVPFTTEWRTKIDQEIDRMEKLWSLYQAHGALCDHDHRYDFENKWCSYMVVQPVNEEERDA